MTWLEMIKHEIRVQVFRIQELSHALFEAKILFVFISREKYYWPRIKQHIILGLKIAFYFSKLISLSTCIFDAKLL